MILHLKQSPSLLWKWPVDVLAVTRGFSAPFLNIVPFSTGECLWCWLVSPGTGSSLFGYRYLAGTGTSLWQYWLHLEKNKIQTCLSAHLCWLWEPCCFSTSVLSKTNRKDPCRKLRYFKKWTNYFLSFYGSCWKV